MGVLPGAQAGRRDAVSIPRPAPLRRIAAHRAGSEHPPDSQDRWPRRPERDAQGLLTSARRRISRGCRTIRPASICYGESDMAECLAEPRFCAGGTVDAALELVAILESRAPPREHSLLCRPFRLNVAVSAALVGPIPFPLRRSRVEEPTIRVSLPRGREHGNRWMEFEGMRAAFGALEVCPGSERLRAAGGVHGYFTHCAKTRSCSAIANARLSPIVRPRPAALAKKPGPGVRPPDRTISALRSARPAEESICMRSESAACRRLLRACFGGSSKSPRSA
jgi:hypothetical protein